MLDLSCVRYGKPAGWGHERRSYHLETNDTTTNDNHLLGNLLELKSTSAGNDALLINVQAGEGSGLRTGGDKNVLAADGLLTTVEQVDLNGVRINEGAGSLNVVNAVLLQQELNTLGQALNGGLLGLKHLSEVELDVADLDTALLGVVENLVVKVGVVEQRLGGDTANVQASTTELSALLDTDSLSKCSVST